MRTPLTAFVLFALAGTAQATTWSEPWQNQVAARADTLGLFEVVAAEDDAVRVRTLKTLAGETTPAEFNVGVDPDMHFTSMSGGDHHEEARPWLRAGQRAYLWLDHGTAAWTLATPSAGIDAVQQDGQHVAATYRISFNQTLQSVPDYEAVQSCLYRHLHEGTCDAAALSAQLDAPLREVPGALSETATAVDQDRFFRQHVALEAAYLLGRDIPLATLEPFLKAGFFHTQLSAVRALAASRDPQRNARLLAFIQDPTRYPTAQTMGVMLAAELGDRDLIAQLKAWEKQAPETDAGLPVELMDPRVGTGFPDSVKAAIGALK